MDFLTNIIMYHPGVIIYNKVTPIIVSFYDSFLSVVSNITIPDYASNAIDMLGMLLATAIFMVITKKL